MKRLFAFAGLLALGSCQTLTPEHAIVSTTGDAVGGAEQRGATYAQTHCGGCHSVGPVGESPLAAAPHFRDLGLRYPVVDLAEAFAEGIVTAHPAMPQFLMSMDENADLIAYLTSIQANPTR